MNDDYLINKRILLLAPYFFGYEKKIVTKLKCLGASVKCINDDPSTFYSTLVETFQHFKINDSILLHRFENKVLKQIGDDKFDIIIVINGWALTKRFAKIIRRDHKKSDGKMYLYYWDSICVLKDDPDRRKYFDLMSTFDTEDYKACSSMSFLPLFFCDEYTNMTNLKPEYDLATVGSYKYNRYFEIEEIKKTNKNIKIQAVLFATRMVKVHKALRKKYKNVDINKFVYEKLSFEQIIELFSKSRAILDIPIAGQDGLTMRTFECLAMRKKIVTTNENIKKYDFYDPRYIYVLDRNNYRLPSPEWFETEGYIDDGIIDKYSIDAWLKTLLGLENHTYLVEQ